MGVFNDFIQLNKAMLEGSVELFFLFVSMAWLGLFLFFCFFRVLSGFGVGVCFGVVLVVDLDNIFYFFPSKSLVFILHVKVNLDVNIIAISSLGPIVKVDFGTSAHPSCSYKYYIQ